MFLLSGKCFLTLSSTDSSGQHLDILLFCSPGPEQRLCKGRSREQHEPPQCKASSTRWQPTAAEHKHPSSGPCGPPSSADSSTDLQERKSDDSSPSKEKTVFMKGQELELDSEGFCSPLLWAHISYFPRPPSSSCPSLTVSITPSYTLPAPFIPCKGKWNQTKHSSIHFLYSLLVTCR